MIMPDSAIDEIKEIVSKYNLAIKLSKAKLVFLEKNPTAAYHEGKTNWWSCTDRDGRTTESGTVSARSAKRNIEIDMEIFRHRIEVAEKVLKAEVECGLARGTGIGWFLRSIPPKARFAYEFLRYDLYGEKELSIMYLNSVIGSVERYRVGVPASVVQMELVV